MNTFESIKIALDSIKVNKLRASLTLLSISIGVFAIMASGTLVDSINNSVETEMAALGENSFMVFRMPHIQIGGGGWWKYRKRKPITLEQYTELRKRMKSTDMINAICASGSNIVKYGNFETDPEVSLIGTDENYFPLHNVNVITGRAFTSEDISFRRNVALVGNDIVVDLFANENPLGKSIKIGNQQFTVIGTLEIKGALLGQSQDSRVIIPLTYFLRYYASEWEQSLDLTIRAADRMALFNTIDEAIGHLRAIRKVEPWEENSFEVETNESLQDQFAGLTGYLTVFGIISGVFALIAAGVGIMNIMLVSVKERTREIGVRKAIGAKRRTVLLQFIIETITLCQVGGIIGITMGIAGAGLLSSLLGMKLAVTPTWIIFSLVVCTVLGIVSGAYPAWKAARLDPIEALRYE